MTARVFVLATLMALAGCGGLTTGAMQATNKAVGAPVDGPGTLH